MGQNWILYTDDIFNLTNLMAVDKDVHPEHEGLV